LALDYLPSVTLSLLLNFTTAAVALLGIALIAEYPTRWQWIGMGIYLFGVLVYFFPIELPHREVIGIVVGSVTVLANAGSAVLGRSINRSEKLSALTVTVVSMGIGSIALLVTGIIVQGIPTMSLQNWLIVAWLAVVNTAFAFTLWNHTLRQLSAVESSVINNTMLIQIAVLAWVFLDETITRQEIVGMIFAAIGTLIVQLSAARHQSEEKSA
jgi:drug/metabolite transporter (DMT)-like permease